MKNKIISRLLAITTMSSIMTGCAEIEPKPVVKEPIPVNSVILDSVESVVEDIDTSKTEECIETIETNVSLENVKHNFSSDIENTLVVSSEDMVVGKDLNIVSEQIEVLPVEHTKLENVIDNEEVDLESDYEPKEDFDRVRAVYVPTEPTEELEEFISEDELISYVYGPAPDLEPVPYEPIEDIPVLVYGPAPSIEPIPYDPIDDIPIDVYGPAPYIEEEIFEPIEEKEICVYGPPEAFD